MTPPLAADGRAVIVAVDHPLYSWPCHGLEDRDALLRSVVAAGADAVITQLFFDNDDYYRYVEDARRVGIDVPIVPGVLSIQSTAQTRRFTALCKSKIPPRLEAMLVKFENDDAAALEMGIEYATEQCEGLIRFGVPGIHFYSLNKSLSVMAIAKNLSLATLA